MDSSHRDLYNDMAQQRSTLKNNQNTHSLRFGFKQILHSPKRGSVFTVIPRRLVVHLRRGLGVRSQQKTLKKKK